MGKTSKNSLQKKAIRAYQATHPKASYAEALRNVLNRRDALAKAKASENQSKEENQ